MSHFSRCLLLVALFCSAYGVHFSYKAPGQTEPCILLDMDFTIMLNASQNNHKVGDFVLSSKSFSSIKVSGRCGIVPIMTLTFPKGVLWSLVFKKPGKMVTLDRSIQFAPKNVFGPKVTSLGDPVVFHSPSTTNLTTADKSYACNTTTVTDYRNKTHIPGETVFTVTTQVFTIKVQAFGVKNGTYSNSVECDTSNPVTIIPATATPATTTPATTAPATTTPATTTPATTAPANTTVVTTPSPAPQNSYYVSEDNVTCIALTGQLSVDIRYEFNNTEGSGMRRVRFDLPSDSKASGNCDLTNNTQNIVISFFKKWSLEMVFKKDSDTVKNQMLGDEQDKLDYRVENMTLTYEIDEEKFPDSVLPVGQIVHETSTGSVNGFPHKSKGDEFYACASTVDLELNKNATVTSTDFKFKAFNDDDDRSFNGTASECSADDNNDDDDKEIIIIVGSVVGGILLITIIVVIAVMCRKKKNNYQNI